MIPGSKPVPTLREGNRRFPSAVAGWKLPGEMESSGRRFHPPTAIIIPKG